MTEFAVGDRVIVVSDVRPSNVGRAGTITQIERFSGAWPYKVEFDDADTNQFPSWVFDAIELRAGSHSPLTNAGAGLSPETTEESDK